MERREFWQSGTIECSEETIQGERYLVFKFPIWKSVNEVLAFVRDQWMKAGGRGTIDKHFRRLIQEWGLRPEKDRILGDVERYETRLLRDERAQRKRTAASKGKPKTKRTELSTKTHRWIDSRYRELKKKRPLAKDRDLAELIAEELEGELREAKIELKSPPFTSMSAESIQKYLSQR